jgi:trans-2-enoyl-CoA reductase
MEKVSAIIIHEHGEPSKVVRHESIELSPPGTDEARVRVAFAPINPADLNVLEGKYPVRPSLPGVPGVEGVGVVEALGADVTDLKVGMPVLLPHRFGTWRAIGNATVAGLVPVTPEIPLEQAAMLRINPATALLMLREFVSLPHGGWVVQNAANSAVGRCVIRIARHHGWRTVNVVRRPELIEELKSEGANVVLVEGETLKDDIAAATDGAPVLLALNAVGGDSATRMANALAPGGVIVTYGAMSRQPLRIPNGLLIFKDIAWRGFWVTRWYEAATPAERAALFAELFDLVRKGVIHTPIERIYPLAEITQAVTHAGQGKRGGKILLKPESP